MQKKGISLIVLVITIIVMIILAATIIISLNNTNVMKKANEAVAKTDKATVQEIADEAWTTAYGDGKRTQIDLENAVTEALEGVDLKECVVKVTTKGVKVLNKKIDWIQNKTEVKKDNMVLEVGQKLKNTTGLPTGYDWYILGAEDGKLLITTNVNIATHQINGEEEKFVPKPDGDYTQDVENYGYPSAIAKLDKDCRDIIAVGEKIEKVRSIRVEDINRVTGYIPIYGNFVTPNVSNYPIVGEMPNGGKVKPNCYYYYPTTLTTTDDVNAINGIANTSAAYNVLFNTNYWLSSSSVFANSVRAVIGFHVVSAGGVSNDYLWDSRGEFYSPSYGVRPAVILKSDFIPEV